MILRIIREENAYFCCRSPLGERGLKYHLNTLSTKSSSSRSPLGERGLKFLRIGTLCRRPSRSPLGERGLK